MSIDKLVDFDKESNGVKYNKFTAYYFPELLNSDEVYSKQYYAFVEKVLSDNIVLYMYYIENKNSKIIEKETNLSPFAIESRLYKTKEKVRYLYEKYKENNCDLSIVDFSRKKEYRRVRDFNLYDKFTKYYFPELVNSEESNSKMYHAFVDKIVNNKEILKMYFKDDMKIREIAEITNHSFIAVSTTFQKHKGKIRELYKKYKQNNNDSNIVDVNKRKDRKCYNSVDEYDKFTHYYFKELINSEEVKSQRYREFVDEVLDSSNILSMYFRDDMLMKDIAKKMNLNVGVINNRMMSTKRKVNVWYHDYKLKNIGKR